jgi:hypothetical protein
MTLRKRLAYATRGFRGGENVTQTLYINQDVELEMPSIFEVSVEKIEDAILSVDIAPYIDLFAEVSVLAEEISVSIEIPDESVDISYIGNEVTIESVADINVTI